jgi:hypothetical protein
MARRRSPKVSRDGRFYWDDEAQTWRPMPPQPEHKPEERRLTCCGVPVAAIIVLAVAYVLIHGFVYHNCGAKPGYFSWPGNCPSGLPFGL